MKRLWSFFSRMDLGFWLLLCVSLNLFIGVLVTTFNDPSFKKLNAMLMPSWFHQMSSRPGLYLWIFPLFVLLLLLAINTIVCTTMYVRTVMRKELLLKKLGVILFHVAFVVALAGHCVSEFIGLNEQVMLDSGTTVQVPGTGLTIETLEIRKNTPIINNEVARMGIEASLRAHTQEGSVVPLNIQTMNPQLFMGYTLHLSFMDKGLSDNQARLIVCRDYGLLLIILAGIIAFIAIVLYVRYTLPPFLWSRQSEDRT